MGTTNRFVTSMTHIFTERAKRMQRVEWGRKARECVSLRNFFHIPEIKIKIWAISFETLIPYKTDCTHPPAGALHHITRQMHFFLYSVLSH